jgi:uncharacterized protein (DUF1697 family)
MVDAARSMAAGYRPSSPPASRDTVAGMTTWIAFLRGVNIGGVRIRMAELATLCGEIGFGEPRTYVQSGNVVFASERDRSDLAGELEGAIAERFGYPIRVILRTPEELDGVLAANPFLADEDRPARLHVVFLDDEPESKAVAELDPDRSPPGRFRVIGREIYLHTPEGYGRSKLTVDWFERRLGVTGTARNWNTVRNLREMA